MDKTNFLMLFIVVIWSVKPTSFFFSTLEELHPWKNLDFVLKKNLITQK